LSEEYLAVVRKRPLVSTIREVIATNAVRGARPIVSLGELMIAEGRPDPWCDRLQQILAEA